MLIKYSLEKSLKQLFLWLGVIIGLFGTLLLITPMGLAENDVELPDQLPIFYGHSEHIPLGNYYWEATQLQAGLRDTSGLGLTIDHQNNSIEYETNEGKRFVIRSAAVELIKPIDSITVSFEYSPPLNSTKIGGDIFVSIYDVGLRGGVNHDKYEYIQKSASQYISKTISAIDFNTIQIEIRFDAKLSFGQIKNLNIQTKGFNLSEITPSGYFAPDNNFFFSKSDTSIATIVWKGQLVDSDIELRILDHAEGLIWSKIQNPYWDGLAKYRFKLPPGWYEIIADIPSISGLPKKHVQARSNFVIMPDTARHVSNEISPFGTHVELSPAGLKKAQMLGAKLVRLHDGNGRAGILKWNAIESRKGHFIFPDQQIKMFHNGGIRILANLGQTPAWASLQPNAVHYPHQSDKFGPAAYLPRSLHDWKNYVQKLCNRYGGIINDWEIWNEPDIHFLVSHDQSKAEAYQKLLQSASSVFNQCADKQLLVAPGVAYFSMKDPYINRGAFPAENYEDFRDPNFLEEYLASDIPLGVKIFSFHKYTAEGKVLSKSILESIESKILSIQKADSTIDETWITEFNHRDLSKSYQIKNSALAQEFCLNHIKLLSYGIDKIITFNAFDNESLKNKAFNFFNYQERPTILFVAYSILTKMLDGYAFSEKEVGPIYSKYLFVEPEGKKIEIYSSSKGDDFEIEISEALAYDYLGKILNPDSSAIAIPLKPYEFIYVHSLSDKPNDLGCELDNNN